MREEPLHLVPNEDRDAVIGFLNEGRTHTNETHQLVISGASVRCADLCTTNA